MGIPDPHHDAQFYQGVVLRRFMAFLIDSVLIFGLWFVGAVVIAAFTLGIGIPLIAPLYFVVAFFYRWMLLSKRSATLGMKFTGIEVRGPDGHVLTNGQAAIHTLGFMVSLFFLPIAIVGWILMATAPEGRAIHDLPLGTVVINRPT